MPARWLVSSLCVVAACGNPEATPDDEPALAVTPLATEAGVPKLVLAARSPARQHATATAAALAHLADVARTYRVGKLPALVARGEVPVAGGTIVRIEQRLDDLPVDGAELRVFVKPDGALHAIAGTLIDQVTTARTTRAFIATDARAAIARALEHASGKPFDAHALVTERELASGAPVVSGRSGDLVVSTATAWRAWVRDGNVLVAAWIAQSFTQSGAWHTVIAADGRVLAHRSLELHAPYRYTVWADSTGRPLDGPGIDGTPHPTGAPGVQLVSFVPPSERTIDALNGPNDPWLPPASTETLGNNVRASSDLRDDGPTSDDLVGTTTAPGVFGHVYDVDMHLFEQPSQRLAGITQLFYTLNYLHDFWYDVGFTEAAGNAQADNFGRGGEGHDALVARTQVNGLNGAATGVPIDGLSPVMRVGIGIGPPGGPSDLALDALLLAHEFGHYLHVRLVGHCATATCIAMSEGWGDFNALLLAIRPGDDLTRAFPTINWGNAGRETYFAWGRMPYSANAAFNALRFRHMADGEPLPTTHPIRVGTRPNYEEHSAGEIWGSALLQAYVALLDASTTDDDEAVRRKMAGYVVAGLLLTTPDATPTEARDAVLAAALAASPADAALVGAAFAERGFGACAVSPPRESFDFVGIVDDYAVGRFAIGEPTFADNVTSCDRDGVLDAGETGRLTVPVSNRGFTALADVTVTIAAASPDVTIVAQPPPIASLGIGETVMVGVDVALAATAVGPGASELSITVASADACEPTITRPFAARFDVDGGAPATTDTFDALTSPWTPTFAHSSDAPVWSRVVTGLDGAWHGVDREQVTDSALVSPPLVAGDGEVVVTLTHRWDFEVDTEMPVAYDGGVVEITTDNGATWQDVTAVGATPGYTATIEIGANILSGRSAYAGKNPSAPADEVTTLAFGTQLAGKTFQLRFRIATDAFGGARGWDIAEVAVAGITNAPFPTIAADACTTDPEPLPDDEAEPNPSGGCCDTGGASSSGLLAFAVLAVLGRKRRSLLLAGLVACGTPSSSAIDASVADGRAADAPPDDAMPDAMPDATPDAAPIDPRSITISIGREHDMGTTYPDAFYVAIADGDAPFTVLAGTNGIYHHAITSDRYTVVVACTTDNEGIPRRDLELFHRTIADSPTIRTFCRFHERDTLLTIGTSALHNFEYLFVTGGGYDLTHNLFFNGGTGHIGVDMRSGTHDLLGSVGAVGSLLPIAMLRRTVSITTPQTITFDVQAGIPPSSYAAEVTGALERFRVESSLVTARGAAEIWSSTPADPPRYLALPPALREPGDLTVVSATEFVPLDEPTYRTRRATRAMAAPTDVTLALPPGVIATPRLVDGPPRDLVFDVVPEPFTLAHGSYTFDGIWITPSFDFRRRWKAHATASWLGAGAIAYRFPMVALQTLPAFAEFAFDATLGIDASITRTEATHPELVDGYELRSAFQSYFIPRP